MKRLLRYGLGFFLIKSTLASASITGWGQNGSEIIKDLNNPWFVRDENGKAFEVRYCVQVKQEFISLPLASLTVPVLIQTAFEYWRNDFKFAFDPLQTGVAKHTFKHVCDSTTDLTFYVGWLPQHIRERMPELKQTIATTVRTEYDDIKLRAKGFVYIAPDKGPDAMSVHNNELIENAWSTKGLKVGPIQTSGGLFQKVVTHEMGHIFGLQHTDYNAAFSDFNIMNAQFGEMIIRKDFPAEEREFFATPTLLNQETLPFPGFNVYFPYFNQLSGGNGRWISDDYKNGEKRKGARAFFDLPADETLGIEIRHNKKEIKIATFNDESGETVQSYVSPFSFSEETDPKFVTMLRVLNKNQVIFKYGPDRPAFLIPGPMMRKLQAKAIFKNTDTGIQRELGLVSDGWLFQLTGVDDSGLIPDVLGKTIWLDNFLGKSLSPQAAPTDKYKALRRQIQSLRKKYKIQ